MFIAGYLKNAVKDDGFFYSILIIIVAATSFGLGRLVDHPPAALSPTRQSATVVLEQSKVASSTSSTAAETGKYVGSKNSTKYHALWCPGAQQIKDSNKVFFESKAAAQAAGYTLAANCQ